METSKKLLKLENHFRSESKRVSNILAQRKAHKALARTRVQDQEKELEKADYYVLEKRNY